MAPIEVIRNFDLYDIVLEESEEFSNDSSIVVPIRSRFEVREVPLNSYAEKSVFDFPVIVTSGGIPWPDGNLYLLERLRHFCGVPPSTLKSIANDLSQFLKWTELEELDYLDVSGRYLKTPCVRFCRYLEDCIISGDLANSTAVRRMNAVIGFYRWLKSEFKIPDVILWHEKEVSIGYANYTGSSMYRQNVVTDLTKRLKKLKQSDRTDGIIYDDGALRPLLRNELTAVRKALSSIGNTEMSLAFDFALLTGARLGSVFTLRENDFSKPLSSFDHIPKIRIGGASYVNSKKGKEMVLIVPPKLYRRVRVYLKGERHAYRKSLSRHEFNNPGASEYVFLTKYGTAYYLSRNDENRKYYGRNKDGDAIRQFTAGTLRSRLKDEGHEFPFNFHDLRATFGLLLLEWEVRTRHLENWVHKGSPDFFSILNYIGERLGHGSLKTTEGYISYKSNTIILEKIQDGFEEFILGPFEI